MTNHTPVLVLPGFGSSGPQHWQTLWEFHHPDWQRVNLGNWNGPACDDWVYALDIAVQACLSPPVLVAHSLACLLVAHGPIVHHESRRVHFSWRCPIRRVAVSLPRHGGLLRCRWRPLCFEVLWLPVPTTHLDR